MIEMLFLIKSKSHSSYFLYIYDVVIFDLRNICCNLRLIILNICQILMHLIFCYTKFKSGAYLSHLEVYAKLWRGVWRAWGPTGSRPNPCYGVQEGEAPRKPMDFSRFNDIQNSFSELRVFWLSGFLRSSVQTEDLCSRLFRSSVSYGRPYGFFFLIIILYPTYFLPNAWTDFH